MQSITDTYKKKGDMNLKQRMKEWVKRESKHLAIFAVSMAMILGIYIFFSEKIEREFIVVPDDFSYMFQIDSVEKQGRKLVLKGWNFSLNQNSNANEYDIILYDSEKDKGYYADIQYGIRDDVNNYFLCDYDYSHSGFIAVFNARKFAQNKRYEILIRQREEREAFATGVYFYENQVTKEGIKNFAALEVENTDLEEVVELGSLKVYRPSEGVYIYQYLGKLYYIFAKEPQSGYTDLFIPLHIYTTQDERLCEEQQNSGFDNQDFYFRTYEISTDCSYRVAVKELPTEYAITYFETGEYIIGTGWKWREKGRVSIEK